MGFLCVMWAWSVGYFSHSVVFPSQTSLSINCEGSSLEGSRTIRDSARLDEINHIS